MAMGISEIEQQLTEGAKAALISRGNAMIGAALHTLRKPAGGSVEIDRNLPEFRELKAFGLVGDRGGLTIRGSALAERLKREQMEKLFRL